MVMLENISDGSEILQRLGHFLIVNVYKAIVHPVSNKVRPIGHQILVTGSCSSLSVGKDITQLMTLTL